MSEVKVKFVSVSSQHMVAVQFYWAVIEALTRKLRILKPVNDYFT